MISRVLASTVLLVAALAGCNGSESSGRQTPDARQTRQNAAPGGESRPSQASLTFGVIHHHDGDLPVGGPVRTQAPSGEALEITGAYLVVSAAELHACEPGDDGFAPSGDPNLINGLYDLLVPPARAHVPSSATRLGTPYVEDLLAPPERAQTIGEIAPPFGQWCTAAAVVAPADDDVLNATALPTEQLVGASFVVEGRWRADSPDASDGGEWTDFQWSTDLARAVEFPAVDPRNGESPLVVDADNDSVMLLIDKQLTPETFAVDPTADRPARRILERVTESFAVHEFARN